MILTCDDHAFCRRGRGRYAKCLRPAAEPQARRKASVVGGRGPQHTFDRQGGRRSTAHCEQMAAAFFIVLLHKSVAKVEGWAMAILG
jgi:hypothetical protein